jgi:coenzyme F420-0:L-glutamate ligase/coenzyme F420-1:gamma-L-glutamate ligase
LAEELRIPELRLIAVPGFPLVRKGDDLVELLLERLTAAALTLESGDVVVFAQKIVSKAEGRTVDLSSIAPSARAVELAAQVKKDPRLVELILRESRRVVRAAPDVLIVEHRLGLVMANAGIDQSNVAESSSGDFALLLPENPDGSAARLAETLAVRAAAEVAVLIVDSFGRPFRVGTVGVAIGAAGLAATLDLRGRPDLFGRTLRVTIVGHADELAAAASVLMGQSAEGRPVVVIRGVPRSGPHTQARELLRPSQEDLFR